MYARNYRNPSYGILLPSAGARCIASQTSNAAKGSGLGFETSSLLAMFPDSCITRDQSLSDNINVANMYLEYQGQGYFVELRMFCFRSLQNYVYS